MTNDTVPISVFKARCLAMLKRVEETGQPIVVTKFGEPVAEIVPPAPEKPAADRMGSLRDRAKVTGDIVAPASDPDDWDVLRR